MTWNTIDWRTSLRLAHDTAAQKFARSTLFMTFATALVLISSLMPLACAWSATPAFHTAQSVAERALDQIFKADINPAVEGSAGQRPITVAPANAPYLKYLTRPLATAILAAEAAYVKTSCNGVYQSGEECGMGYDAITCAQDVPDYYLFRTIQSTPNLVVIEAAWPSSQGEPERSGTYRLTLDGRAWKIDGISCPLGARFN